MRQLVALYKIATTVGCKSKCGIDLYNQHSRDVYAAYFYVTGLDGARELYPLLRQAIDRDPQLGPDVRLVIKRGCSEYEAALGPSDGYTFRPELQDIEAHLRPRFRRRTQDKAAESDALAFAAMLFRSWIPFAYQIGDETYLDFTGGRPLYPASVTYDPVIV